MSGAAKISITVIVIGILGMVALCATALYSPDSVQGVPEGLKRVSDTMETAFPWLIAAVVILILVFARKRRRKAKQPL